ncbi:MAG: hypothetical protein LCH80_09115 [Proteobacteria bacterium]|nr:hypothetical protein [Pseudomonadota bacterium]
MASRWVPSLSSARPNSTSGISRAAQDKLQRANAATMCGYQLVTNLLTQLQNAVTLLALVAGLVFFVPWLIVLLLVALLPTLLVEAHFAAAH